MYSNYLYIILFTIISEKDASKNKSESKKSKKTNKTDTLSVSSSNTKMESVGYEKEKGTAEIIEENSSNSPNKDDNETAVSINIIHQY